MRPTRWIQATLAAGCVLSFAAARAPAEEAKQILAAAGVKGGLVVHLGCGDGKVTAALRANDSYLVHGLDTDAANIAKAREHIRSKELYGPVSVDVFDGKGLPYIDNLVNLLVAEDLGKVPMDEVIRVLAPKGVAYIKQAQPGKAVPQWKKTVKPWPADIDEWTHYLHGADNNAVAHDRVVANPSRLQWIQNPLWLRSHNLNPGLSAMVSARGRLFMIMDESPPGIAGMPGQWSLVAMDAFNGLPLWKRPIKEWGWRHWSDKEYGVVMRFMKPQQLMRRLVAADDRIFVTEGITAPVSMLDAATGRPIRVYKGTERTCEIVYWEGKIILAVNDSLGTSQKEPRISIMAADVKTGKMLWRSKPCKGLSPKTDSLHKFANVLLTVANDKVFYVDGQAIVCLDLTNGGQLWRIDRPPLRPEGEANATEKTPEPRGARKLRFDYYLPDLCTLVYTDGTLLFSGMYDVPGNFRTGQEKKAVVTAIDAKTGKSLWSKDCSTFAHYTPPDIFVIDGLAWVLDGKTKSLVGAELRTGKIKRSVDVKSLLWSGGGHHRCFRNKATTNFIVMCRRVTEFVDLKSGKIDQHKWTKGACGYGIMPANGLLYVPAHNCSCMMEGKLTGFHSLASAGDTEPTSPENSLQRGPAYNSQLSPVSSGPSWPTYRADSKRSGFSASQMPDSLAIKWRTKLNGRLTATTSAAGKVFVVSRDQAFVHCLDERTGDVRWQYTAGGRIDSPPTYYKGRVIFGSRDGYVYCLDADSGKLAWRLRAAPRNALLCAFGQLESPWPVFGSVLVANGKVYCVAGRSTHVDGGIYLYAINVTTGKVAVKNRLGKGPILRLADILVADGENVIMRGMALRKTDLQPVAGKQLQKHSGRGSFFTAYGGFLDDTLFNASCWSLGPRGVWASMLAYDETTTVGVRTYRRVGPSYLHDVFRPEQSNCQLFVTKTPQGSLGQAKASEARKGRGKAKGKATVWSVKIPIRPNSLLLSKNNIYLAGVADRVDKQDPWGLIEGRKGGVLAVYSRSDGRKLSELQLDAAPEFDALAAAGGKLFLSLRDGTVLCIGAK